MSGSFPHRHLLGIEQLSKADIETILERAAHFAQRNRSDQKKCETLAGKIVVNAFFENSTRTRTSFEIAAKRLGADVVNFAVQQSSVNKGESFSDTMRVIDAMQVDAFVIRHYENGAVEKAAGLVQGTVLNAGDGAHEHPTQALLDALTMLRHKGKLEGLRVAICGDIEHSRVARSNALLLNKFGADVRFFAPPQFAPRDTSKFQVTVCPTMEEAINNADVVMMLRIQNERLSRAETVMSSDEYHRLYGLDHRRLKAAMPDVIVMHPAPMNRGVEITSALADDPAHSVIFEQMEMGVAVRMACLELLLAK